MPAAKPVITLEVKHLSMAFAGRQILKSLSFRLDAGVVVGFLGANGAGKSTTMRLITGFLKPLSGTVSVCGFDMQKQQLQARSCIGYLPEAAGGFGQLNVAEFLHFCAQARGLSNHASTEAIDRVCIPLELHSALSTPLRRLSKGWRQRAWLAQALLHDPPVLILDEPADGLDPNQKRNIHALIREIAADKIILLSTHSLEEVEAICDRAIILADGQIQADAATEQLADAQGRLSATFYQLTQ